MKDKLFFFGAIDPSWRVTTLTAPPTFPLASLGEVDRDRRTVSYAAKGTLQLGGGHRIDASFFGDPSHGPNGPQRTSALLVTNTASFSTLDYGGHQQSFRYSGLIASGFLIEGGYSRSLNTIGELPSVNDWRYTDRTVTPNIITGGVHLRAGQPKPQQSVPGQGDEHLQVALGEVRFRVLRRDLLTGEPAHWPNVHSAGWPPDCDRRESGHSSSGGSAGRENLPCDPRELQ
jgi:hypothetical protein